MIQRDKIYHFIAGFLLGLTTIIWTPLVIVGLLAGIGKEIYDHFYGSGWNSKDFIATLLGWLISLLIVVVVT